MNALRLAFALVLMPFALVFAQITPISVPAGPIKTDKKADDPTLSNAEKTAAAPAPQLSEAQRALLRLVNPFVGTDAHGHTFPGPSAPFGMVQLSPDTRRDMRDWDGCSGYHYSDSRVYGFSHTHLSGTGVGDYGDVLVLPFLGKILLEPDEYAAPFSKKNERAEPGYYTVWLENGGILAELTATERTGLHRYTFPQGEEVARLLVDLRHRDLTLDAQLERVSDREIAGYRSSRSWAREQHLYFVVRFSKPMLECRILDATEGIESEQHQKLNSPNAVGVLGFRNDPAPLIVQVGISAVSIAGARANLDADGSGLDFNRAKAETQAKWADALSKIEVETSNLEQKSAFYTALYHTMLQPNLFSDADGQYRGRDQKIHRANGHDVYTVFSLWDTYRAANPLYTLLEPRRVGDFAQTFLRQYEQGGLLPIWELAANETDCMIGNHAIPVLADAWLKGIRNFDGKLALEAMLKSARQDRYGFDWYKKLGYIPSEKEPESVSKTLEYAFDDWAISLMASSLGRKDVADEFARRALNYRNIFDPESKFFRAKNNAIWHTPFDPFEVNFNYTEANAWQYRFAAPQDVSGMMRLHGGREGFAAALDALFSAKSATSGRNQADITGLIGQYVQGNEPSHHMAYLYNFAGQPAKTQQRVRQIMDEMYSPRPDGLSGNEDCGQMSAWLVFSAMGFYPAVPVGGQYVIGTPLFDRSTLRLPNGKSLTINAEGASAGRFYIKSARLNGQPLTQTWLSHEQILRGGDLVFEMSDTPTTWGTAEADCPKSSIEASAVAIPFVAKGERVFREKQHIELSTLDAGAAIHYTLDGSAPTSKSMVYAQPILLSKTTKVRAIAFKNGQKSPVMEAEFNLMQPGLKILRYNTRYNPQYTGRGDEGLIDQLRGGNDFRSGGWQGYEGANLDVVLDLGSRKTIRRLKAGFLQDENSWVFFPSKVKFEISDDGQNFRPAGEAATKIAPQEMGSLVQDFVVTLPAGTSTRYIRAVGVSLARCPDWHKGVGNPCWIMADEVMVE